MKREITIYPFTAIVGQERMKLALILNIINPSLGGVLIRGEKGTAKSTAVRSLADLLPKRTQVAGCKFSCSPDDSDYMCEACGQSMADGVAFETTESKMRVIDLPISATEDRVVGTLDIEQAIKKGEKKFEPGILAQANRNILYVDEINLLDDHVVDILLDSAAMGVNFIEREGISFAHPARFTLVGTMNPEEGDLRPQLIDRFGLVVDVVGEKATRPSAPRSSAEDWTSKKTRRNLKTSTRKNKSAWQTGSPTPPRCCRKSHTRMSCWKRRRKSRPRLPSTGTELISS